MRIERLELEGSNAYLVRAEGAILVDTGPATARVALVEALRAHGILPGDLRLVVLTHVDARSAGNAAFLQRHFRAPVAVHSADAPILASGLARAPRIASPLGVITRWFQGLRFLSVVPDLVFGHTLDLRLYGIPATTVHTPSATIGSCTVLLSGGDAIVGDLVMGGWCGGRLLPHRAVRPTLAEVPERVAHGIALLERLGARRIHPGQGGVLRMADARTLTRGDASAEALGPSAARKRERRLAEQLVVRT